MDVIWKIGLVGVGGAGGAIARFWLGSWITRKFEVAFPLGTLLVNFTGSFILGCVLGVFRHTSPALVYFLQPLLVSGFLGGYTTFSTFAYETLTLWRENKYIKVWWYLGLSLLAGVGGAFLGFTVFGGG